jgi:hypothetical protein
MIVRNHIKLLSFYSYECQEIQIKNKNYLIKNLGFKLRCLRMKNYCMRKKQFCEQLSKVLI